MRKRPLLLIEWDDVSSWSGWESIDKYKGYKPARAKMVGWRIHGDRQNIVIASALDNDDCCNGVRVIPRGCIRSMRELE